MCKIIASSPTPENLPSRPMSIQKSESKYSVVIINDTLNSMEYYQLMTQLVLKS